MGRRCLCVMAAAALALILSAACSGTDAPVPQPRATGAASPSSSLERTAIRPSPTAAGAPVRTPSATAATPEAAAEAAATSAPGPTAAPTATPGGRAPLPDAGRPPDPTTTSDAFPVAYTTISVGRSHACALRGDGEVACWDGAPGDPWPVPSGPYTSVRAKNDQTCALTDGGKIVCWARGGEPIPEDEVDPSRAAPPGPYAGFDWDDWLSGFVSGGVYSCALAESRDVVCWGLENLPPERAHLAPPDPPAGEYEAIRVESAHHGLGIHSLTACALAAAGDVVCWGIVHSHLQLLESFTTRYPGSYEAVGDVFCDRTGKAGAVPLGGTWCDLSGGGEAGGHLAISPGEDHVCAVTAAGTATCETERRSVSYELRGVLSVMAPPDPAPERYVTVSTGGTRWVGLRPLVRACALTDTGRIVCWENVPNKVARPDPAPGRYVAVSDGRSHTCALTADGEAACWGWNNLGQAEVPAGRYAAISAGHWSTWAVTFDGELVTWGSSSPPRRFPSTGDRYVDVEVSVGDFGGACALTASGEAACWPEGISVPDGPLRSVSLGWGGSGCALTPSGVAACWEWDGAPAEVPEHAYVMISAGACGVTERGDVVCWDRGIAGPPDLPAGRYVSVRAGTTHGCALTDEGAAHCWGAFGDHDSGYSYGPVDPPPGRYTAITSGHHRACGLTEDGTVVCWGDTDYEQLAAYDLPYRE